MALSMTNSCIQAVVEQMHQQSLASISCSGQIQINNKPISVLQAGRPKTITGFQTHTTPVLLSAGERAELASEKYLPLSPVLEGVVILKANPNYIEVAE